jgi:RNA polymerase sigma factor (sigma-70 family)
MSAPDIQARPMTMAKGQTASALRQLQTLFAAGTTTGLTDGELLERYKAERALSAEAATAAETAFEVLVNRHGPMVWGICHRVLGDAHEAEDAFQATFLVLVRKAGSVRVDGSLGRWLYGVAHRVALRARSEARRRGSWMGPAPATSSDDPVGEVERSDLRNTVGEELDRLPAKYRCPVELCHLQGMTYDQAARQLNWPVATVKSRLTKGRLRLRERLARRGIAPGAVGLATALTHDVRASIPQELLRSTARAATSCAAGAFPAVVTNLTEGVLKMMMWEKLKLVMACAVVVVGLTAEVLSQQAPVGRIRGLQKPEAAAPPSRKADAKAETDSRWVRSLPNGATIQVVGISLYPSGPDTWWRPDGTPLPEPPCERSATTATSDGDAILRSVVVRLINIPAKTDQNWWINEANGGSQGPARRNGQFVPDLSEAVVRFPARTEVCTIHFKAAAGPWSTVQTSGTNSGAVARVDASFIFGDAIATKKGTSLSVTHNIQKMAVRIVAVDDTGEEQPGAVRSCSAVTDFQQIVVEFALPADQIKQFRVQTRPYQEVEIPGIHLKHK